MRIIPVIDLRRGRAVRGRAGDRERYLPVTSLLGGGPPADLSDPAVLLSAYRAALRPATIYVADLDRIGRDGDNDAVLSRLARRARSMSFLWDGGLAGAAEAARLFARNGRIVPVIGTETLRSIDDLRPLRRPGAPIRPVLSLDLREAGVVSRSALVSPLAEAEILAEAARRGCRGVIVLLLDRVGTLRGLPRDRLIRLRAAAPELDFLAGGGVASIEDLVLLRDAGFSGALVATALHDGLISPRDLERQGFIA